MVYPVGANVIAVVRGKIIRRFADANAFSEATAKTLKELNLENKHEVIMNSFIRRGNIIKTNGERYYLDHDYYQKLQKRKKILIPILLLLCIIVIIISLCFSL